LPTIWRASRWSGGARAGPPTNSDTTWKFADGADSRRYAPGYDAPLDLYLKQLDENGISNGVLVQPSFLGTDNSYPVQCVLAARGRLRGIAVVDPGASSDDLNRLNGSGVVGLRLNLVDKPLPDLASRSGAGCLNVRQSCSGKSRCSAPRSIWPR
jgi:predicted TIM-barrel fold metal-dependent hydrolase